jgi:hypothetical protein
MEPGEAKGADLVFGREFHKFERKITAMQEVPDRVSFCAAGSSIDFQKRRSGLFFVLHGCPGAEVRVSRRVI